LLVIAGVGLWFGYHLGSRPAELKVAVGPPERENHALLTGLSRRLADTKASVRLQVVSQPGSVEAARALDRGEVDLAVIRADVSVPSSARALAIMQKHAVIVLATDRTKKALEDFSALLIFKHVSDALAERRRALAAGPMPSNVPAVTLSRADAVPNAAPTPALDGAFAHIVSHRGNGAAAAQMAAATMRRRGLDDRNEAVGDRPPPRLPRSRLRRTANVAELHAVDAREETDDTVVVDHLHAELDVLQHDIGRAPQHHMDGIRVLLARFDAAPCHPAHDAVPFDDEAAAVEVRILLKRALAAFLGEDLCTGLGIRGPQARQIEGVRARHA
jgi:hypothetical protein